MIRPDDRRAASDQSAYAGEINRRRFLRRTALACSVGFSGCTAPPRSVRLDATHARGSSRVQLELAQLPELSLPHGVVRLLTPSQTFFLRRQANGELTTVSAVCPHQRCLVRPTKRGFACPCHGSKFTARGDRTAGPAREGLERIVTTEREGIVTLDGIAAR